MTGLSGSGKSSLAFDTLYAEGQRRYVESLSSYARQFLGQMEKPDVDYIEGLSPAISIDQKTTSKNPRSTVGTVTEIHDYLRLLYARIGVPHCPVCGKEIQQQTVDQMVDQGPGAAGAHAHSGAGAGDPRPQGRARQGVGRPATGRLCPRAGGRQPCYELTEEIKLEKNKKHTIEVVVDRLIVRQGVQQAPDRFAGNGDEALRRAGGHRRDRRARR